MWLKSLWLDLLIGVLLLIGAGLGVAWYSAWNTTNDGAASGTEYEGTKLDGPAPQFELVDQKGKPVALADFGGKVVVLTFLDSVCTETCPLTALELRKVHHLLGQGAEEDLTEQVVFLGINVNVDYNRQEDVQAFTDKFGLDEIPSWHFLTGGAEALAPVWEAYGIQVVKTDPDDEEYEHSPGVYVIDQNGELRWHISTPLLLDGLAEPWRGPKIDELLVRHVRELVGTETS